MFNISFVPADFRDVVFPLTTDATKATERAAAKYAKSKVVVGTNAIVWTADQSTIVDIILGPTE